MRMVRFLSFLGCLSVLSLFTACESLPGKPTIEDRWVASNDITNFKTLYGMNCAGCHGADGRLGAALPLNDSLYLAVASKEKIQNAISKGVPGTSMPAFAMSSGGTLTAKQIELLVEGLLSAWGRPQEFKEIDLPPYSSQAAITEGSGPGDPTRGSNAYHTFCAQCHGNDGSGGKAGSVVDPNFLGLVSDQGLRTTVIVGRSDLGKPDWRNNIPGKPMTPQDISDVVAWLASQRPSNGSQQGGNP
jgi:mono/diheme cytochrome c family protein